MQPEPWASLPKTCITLTLWSRIFTNKTEENPWTPTCLVVSHRPSVLRRADQIILMKAGRVEA
ncbi:hypothetical protein PN465_10025 [Nodularia spumigena CS-584]|jgi:ATP-binding cassette, subfamily B, bacterial|uniref:ABC transporter ATP-binding protein n=1 Tax=Nodularia spumigena UHCC 0060 TaxID=3110300 RepID=A0ABU5USX9_NODSP|nr:MULTISPECIES: hypothetical protein [Cyanophyceae]MDB9355643.1 hypothetical protein [Nodularia spumigena CS-587/03]AHJ31209.1 ATP-binding protein of ABC transporter [Nodularia spumigena CCY9414]EAW42584.1 ATP-binding protein of ABC transporter [Nodularia spumigena CCY9414]MDB9304109.1 hypothetical protein [Nodularia spumigena CS-591/12]MDB9319476.1 hypothetical protein [Nodularia spumigena CS-590/01A]